MKCITTGVRRSKPKGNPGLKLERALDHWETGPMHLTRMGERETCKHSGSCEGGVEAVTQINNAGDRMVGPRKSLLFFLTRIQVPLNLASGGVMDLHGVKPPYVSGVECSHHLHGKSSGDVSPSFLAVPITASGLQG